jgi:acetate kinase
MGIALDEGRNRADDRLISADGAATPVVVVPTDEETVIARATRVAIG